MDSVSTRDVTYQFGGAWIYVGHQFPVEATWRYNQDNPFDVAITLQGRESARYLTIAREDIVSGTGGWTRVKAALGCGSITLTPTTYRQLWLLDGADPARLRHFSFPMDKVDEFLAETYDLVPLGDEEWFFSAAFDAAVARELMT